MADDEKTESYPEFDKAKEEVLATDPSGTMPADTSTDDDQVEVAADEGTVVVPPVASVDPPPVPPPPDARHEGLPAADPSLVVEAEASDEEPEAEA
jgi:hypothetical protein